MVPNLAMTLQWLCSGFRGHHKYVKDWENYQNKRQSHGTYPHPERWNHLYLVFLKTTPNVTINHPYFFPDFFHILLLLFGWKNTCFLIWKCTLDLENNLQCRHQQWATPRAHHRNQQAPYRSYTGCNAQVWSVAQAQQLLALMCKPCGGLAYMIYQTSQYRWIGLIEVRMHNQVGGDQLTRR